MSIKYLSSSGLTEVWSNIKTYIASKIPSKIVTGLSIKGRTITYTNSDGSTGTLTTQDTNTTYSVATTSTNGLMSSTDKTKLDGIAAGANNYTHPSSHPASMITGLTKVATSGSYNDLTNKPTIPTVNNATLTIQKNGTTVKTFTANASANVTANITVPTKTSELTNNSGFLTSHSPVDSSLSSTSTNAIQNKVVNAALNNKANNSDVVHKSGAETIVGTKTFSSQIKGDISGTSSNVVVGSDTATARGYLVDGNLPRYTWENGSQLIAGRIPLITDFNNLTKPGVYHVIFCLNDGYVHEEKEYKESLNRPSLPDSTTGFRDGILEIKRTSTMSSISSRERYTQKLTILSGLASRSYFDLTYQRACIMYSPSSWTAWKRVARDEEVVHRSGAETIDGLKTFNSWQIINMGLNVRWITGNKEEKSLHLSGGMDDKYVALGAHLELHGDDEHFGTFVLNARDRTVAKLKQLVGSPDGTLTWNNANILTDANQIMVLKNLTGNIITSGAVIDCGTGNGLLAGWYIDAAGGWALTSNKITGKWKNVSIYHLGSAHSAMFVKVG